MSGSGWLPVDSLDFSSLPGNLRNWWLIFWKERRQEVIFSRICRQRFVKRRPSRSTKRSLKAEISPSFRGANYFSELGGASILTIWKLFRAEVTLLWKLDHFGHKPLSKFCRTGATNVQTIRARKFICANGDDKWNACFIVERVLKPSNLKILFI